MDPPPSIDQYRRKAKQSLQMFLDRAAPHNLYRWIGWGALLLIYFLRVYFLQVNFYCLYSTCGRRHVARISLLNMSSFIMHKICINFP